MPTAKKSANPARNPALDQAVQFMRTKAFTPVANCCKVILDAEEITEKQIIALVDMMRLDPRFIVDGDGAAARCVLITEEREVSGGAEPEEIKIDVVTESGVNNPQAIITGPTHVVSDIAGTGEGIQVAPGQPAPGAIDLPPIDTTPTLGEHIAQAETIASKQETIPGVGETIHHQAETHDAELESRFEALREIAEELETFEAEHARLKKASSEAKKAVDTTRAKMIELINGDTAEEVSERPVFKMAKETPPPATTASLTLNAVAAVTPEPSTTSEINTGLNFWEMGAASARKNPGGEYGCPISREKDAQGVGYWFAGFRNALVKDSDSHEALVQGLTRDALLKAALPGNGLLPKGEEQPKVQIVKWNERAHLVLDMVIMEDPEQDPPIWEEWALQPLFDKDEWGTLWQPTYGHPVKIAHENPEKEETRLKGGVDCGRLVKAGRNVFVIGPREMVALVYCPKAEG